jgi:hypothetical protein
MKAFLFFGGALLLIIVVVALMGGNSGPPLPIQRGALLPLTEDNCPAMPTERGWNEVRRALSVGDSPGAARSLVEGGGKFLAAGTSVMVRDVRLMTNAAEVTIQSAGPDIGMRWFIGLNCLSPKPAR